MLELLLIVALIVFFGTRCRRNHPAFKELQGWAYAHRGLHGRGIPENSMAAFRAALDKGYGAELDVHLLADGNLAVIHDSLLNRTTGQSGHVEDLVTADLKDYYLEMTRETIPELMDVLTLFDGKAPLIIELKTQDGNHALLAEAVCDMLKDYKGAYCLESFDPRCIAWLKKNRPNVIRGQLTENYFKTRNDLPDHLRFVLTHNLTHFLSVPDFIAWKFDNRKYSPLTWVCRNVWGCQGVAWTLKTQADYDTAIKEGWLPIFEGFEPGVKRMEQ